MPEKMLKEEEMRFLFSKTFDIDGNVKSECIEWNTLGGNSHSSREDFAKRFVDHSEGYHTAKAYHSMDRNVEGRPYIEIARVKDNVLVQVQGASSPTDYLYELAHVVQQEILRRNPKSV